MVSQVDVEVKRDISPSDPRERLEYVLTTRLITGMPLFPNVLSGNVRTRYSRTRSIIQLQLQFVRR